MIKLDKNDPLVLSVFTKEYAECRDFLVQVLDAGISRQKFKMLISAMNQDKSVAILEEIVNCDFDTKDGFFKAANLADVEIVDGSWD